VFAAHDVAVMPSTGAFVLQRATPSLPITQLMPGPQEKPERSPMRWEPPLALLCAKAWEGHKAGPLRPTSSTAEAKRRSRNAHELSLSERGRTVAI
jgi:hypothetical protein